MTNTVVSMQVSDRWLRTYVAVAESGSFTAAGRRLGVGQSAVSHAVARLEAALGVALVERSTRGLTLTTSGRMLYERLTGAFTEIDNAVLAAQTAASSQVVSLSVSTSLANFWLLPRLPAFKRLHPETDLRVITTDSDIGVGVDDADLWIPLGSGRYPNLEATPFRAERILPVANPEVAADLGQDGPTKPGQLLVAPLIHLEERYTPRYDWNRWFADHDVAVSSPLAGYRSNDYSLVLQAVLDGQGVALGWEHIVTNLLSDGRLVALADPIETGQPFPILRRPTASTEHSGANEGLPDASPNQLSAHHQRVGELRDWLRDTT